MSFAYQDLRPRIPDDGLTGRQGKPYHPSADLVAAANVALALGRPLLLTGEPGCGKTDFAWAVEGALREHGDPDDPGLLECHVRSDSRARDLLYHYDALTRFGDAHHGGPDEVARARDPRNYVKLHPLGRALISRHLRVVLIDEIDKAPRDLPNDLLRELEQACFTIPEIPDGLRPHPSGLQREKRRPADGKHRPLVIITSNVERQLPDPFLRRCIFYHLEFPKPDRLRTILEDWFPDQKPVSELAIRAFTELRRVDSLTKKPATSELVDWTQALLTVFDRQQVLRALEEFEEKRRSARQPESLPWHDLPALSCLVKLREDLHRLQAG